MQTNEKAPSTSLQFFTAPLTDMERRFAEFHKANGHVYMALESLALRAHVAGVKKLGISALTETLRYNAALQTAGDAYKINNNYRALYARMLLTDHPELRNLLDIRIRPSALFVDSPYKD